MLRTSIALAAVIAFAGFDSPAQAACKDGEHVSKAGDGFHCGNGSAFGVKLTSKKLQAALAGHKADLGRQRCPKCRLAGKTNDARVSSKTCAAKGVVYHSPVACALAKGTIVTNEMVACSQACASCKTAYAKSGRCEDCNNGFVAGRVFENKEDYVVALAAHKTLERASEASRSCEGCAVALVTDGECPKCEVKFKDGKLAYGKSCSDRM